MTGESAIIAAAVSSAFSVATLIITRIKCYYKRGEEGCEGCEGCRCGCLDKPIIDDNNDIDAHEFTLGDTPIIIICKNLKNKYIHIVIYKYSTKTEME